MAPLDTIRNFILQHGLLSRSDRILVAVSGGADSVFLLHALHCFQPEFAVRLYVAHLNHGLRKSADKDERFVIKLAKELNLPVHTQKISLPKETGSLEEAARKARLKFLVQAAQKYHCAKIALGHTQDDLAETVLMRIFRGTGLSGLRAILPKRQINGFTFIRPLLGVSRRTLETFLKKNRVSFCMDPTNADMSFFRNRVRRKLLPYLSKELGPGVKRALAALAQSAADDYDFLFRISGRHWKRIVKSQTKTRISLKLPALTKLHPSLQRSIVRMCVWQLKGDTNALTFAHWEEMEALIDRRPAKSEIRLPKNIFSSKKGEELIFTLRKS